MASITTVPDKSTGDIFTETMWDASIRDNLNNGVVTQLGCRVYQTNNVTTTSADAAVSFNASRFDNDVMHSNSTNPTRITFNTAGLYVCGGAVEWQADTARLSTKIRLNGTTLIAGTNMLGVGGGTATRQNCATLYQFAASDYIELLVSSANSITINNTNAISPEFWACRL